MSKLRTFFGGKPIAPVVENKSDIQIDNELYLTITRQLGKENETIRTLLTDAEQKIQELDIIKRTIAEQVDPVSKTLRALDETKSKLGAAEDRIATIESENGQLRVTLSAAQRKLAALESTNAGQTKSLASCQTQIADLKSRVSQISSDLQAARDENRRLTDRVSGADRQQTQLGNDLASTRQKLEATQQKLTASESERTGVQKSLDNALAELSQMSQRLIEADKVSADAKQRYESDVALRKENYEALKTRFELTHNLLEETRRGMLERAKEIQSSIAA